MKTNVDFVYYFFSSSLGFLFGIILCHAVGFLGALTIAAAGYIMVNLIIRYLEKRRRK